MEIDSTLVEIDSKMELIEGNGSNYSKTFHNINEQEIPISSTIAVELEKVAATYSITFTVTKRSSKGCQKKKKKKKDFGVPSFWWTLQLNSSSLIKVFLMLS